MFCFRFRFLARERFGSQRKYVWYMIRGLGLVALPFLTIKKRPAKGAGQSIRAAILKSSK